MPPCKLDCSVSAFYIHMYISLYISIYVSIVIITLEGVYCPVPSYSCRNHSIAPMSFMQKTVLAQTC